MDHDAIEESWDTEFVGRLQKLLAEPGATQVELQDPPEDLWPRIAAALDTAPLAVEYRIDSDDMVVGVADDWGSFAAENGAEDLAALGSPKTLWSYFDSEEIAELWRLVVERVRATGSTATVPLRCDSPSARRWFEMKVIPAPDRSVRFRSELQFEEPRTEVPLLDPAIERDEAADPVAICSWCAQGDGGDEWLDIEDLLRRLRLLEDALPSVSYGICPSCRDAMSADLLVTDSSQGSSQLD